MHRNVNVYSVNYSVCFAQMFTLFNKAAFLTSLRNTNMLNIHWRILVKSALFMLNRHMVDYNNDTNRST